MQFSNLSSLGKVPHSKYALMASPLEMLGETSDELFLKYFENFINIFAGQAVL